MNVVAFVVVVVVFVVFFSGSGVGWQDKIGVISEVSPVAYPNRPAHHHQGCDSFAGFFLVVVVAPLLLRLWFLCVFLSPCAVAAAAGGGYAFYVCDRAGAPFSSCYYTLQCGGS